jgi:hypothetical protein
MNNKKDITRITLLLPVTIQGKVNKTQQSDITDNIIVL